MSTGTSEIQTYFGRCRCCLQYGYLKDMWEEHYCENDKEIYVEMLVECFALTWVHSEESKANDQICTFCIKKLRIAHNFKKVVLKSQDKLLGHTYEETVKIEKSDCSVDYNTEEEGFIPEVHIEDPDDPEFVDPEAEEYKDEDHLDPTDVDYLDETNESSDMDYQEIEYLEDEECKEPAGDEPPKMTRRTKTPAKVLPDRKWPRKLPKSERYKTYKQYTQEDLRKCLNAVKNEEMTPHEAAEMYNIPKKTLIAKIKMESQDVDNGKPTTNKDNKEVKKNINKHNITVFHDKCNIQRKIDKIKLIKTNKDEVKDTTERIKSEDNIEINADTVRIKYKAIVNAKLNKDIDQTEINDVNEMNKHKNNIKHILENSNATMTKGFWRNAYHCCFCDTRYEIPSQLKLHNLEKHRNIADSAIKTKYISHLTIRLDITNLKCNICSKQISDLEILINHLEKEHAKVFYRDVKSFIIPFKFDTDPLTCIKCNKKFKFFKLLSEHMCEHYRNYDCPKCDRTFINKQSLQSHSYRHKSGKFKCAYCPKVFDTQPNRSVHQRIVHTLNNKTRKCTYCDERFSTKDLVQAHETKFHGAAKPIFNCDACNKSYDYKSSLMTHRKRYHLMLRPHKCSYCEMAFFSRIELRSHTVTHTKSRDFKCEMCSKCFGTRCSLNQHVRGHLNDRKFKCESCERAFVHRTAYRVHMRTKHAQIV